MWRRQQRVSAPDPVRAPEQMLEHAARTAFGVGAPRAAQHLVPCNYQAKLVASSTLAARARSPIEAMGERSASINVAALSALLSSGVVILMYNSLNSTLKGFEVRLLFLR